MSDIVENLNRLLAGDKQIPAAYKSRLTKARDEIVRLRMGIESLRNQLHESKHCQCGYDDVCEFARERDAARAELEVIKQQKPALTDEEITSIAYDCNALPEVITDESLFAFARAIERISKGK